MTEQLSTCLIIWLIVFPAIYVVCSWDYSNEISGKGNGKKGNVSMNDGSSKIRSRRFHHYFPNCCIQSLRIIFYIFWQLQKPRKTSESQDVCELFAACVGWTCVFSWMIFIQTLMCADRMYCHCVWAFVVFLFTQPHLENWQAWEGEEKREGLWECACVYKQFGSRRFKKLVLWVLPLSPSLLCPHYNNKGEVSTRTLELALLLFHQTPQPAG